MKKLMFDALAAGLFLQGHAGSPERVSVCHVPVPNPKVVQIPAPSLPGHISHGDFLMPGVPDGAPCIIVPQ
jgi:hypothetical protein